MDFLHGSISDNTEADLVSFMLGSRHSMLYGTHGIDARFDRQDRIKTAVERSRYRRDLEGDFDIVVVPPARPEESVSLQVKRIKVSATGAVTGRPNGLTGIAKGIEQANDDAALGFKFVYLVVFIVIDTRLKNAGRFTYEGPTPEMRWLIDDAIRPIGLDPRVGLMTCEEVQTMDQPAFTVGTGHIALKRTATAAPQSRMLTTWLDSLVAA
jgi:hypothetical protein